MTLTVGAPPLGEPGRGYQPENEAQFRRRLEQWMGTVAAAVRQLDAATPRTPVFFVSGSASVTGGQTRYFGDGNLDTVADNASLIVPYNGTLSDLFVRSSVAPGAGETYTFRLMRNNAEQATLSATITNPNQTDDDLTGSVSVTAGDLVAMRVITSASATVASFQASLMLEPA